MQTEQAYPIDRVLFETTEFCENSCHFCYGDYGPEGKHMSPERFDVYLGNLIKADLLAPESLLILFGGEMLNHPDCLEICRIAEKLKKTTMNLVIITSGKYRDEYSESVDALLRRADLLHHWEVSIKDIQSFRFGMKILASGHTALFRYDYLNPTNLKNSIETFFKHVKSSGIWKEFRRNNPRLEKDLRYARREAAENRDTVIIVEFFYPENEGQPRSVGLTFSPLDRSVLRRGAMRAPAQCSLFEPQYQKAIHVTRDGSIFPCHLPRFKKRCEPLGNASDVDFLFEYRSKIEEFKEALERMHETESSEKGICIDGCRRKVSLSS
jgi:MoaA/NifB/PqqE/SkfB family radical SAM enzyme